jgi:TetR/AcrR family transcriptional repressor of nem operon
MPSPPQKQKTRDRILDVAERLVQTRGFNAFSYADIADALHVTKASLHYHFPTKADLGRQLIERYGVAFTRALADIDKASNDAAVKLRSYVNLYREVLRANRMCLCGMLAAEFATLPKPMKVVLKQFFETNEQWLIRVLDQGRATTSLSFAGEANERAHFLVGSLEGAMMLARSYGKIERFDASADRLLADIGVSC